MFCIFIVGNSAGASQDPTINFIFTQNLTVEARGNDVSVLQQFLIDGGFLKISTPTGYFGSLTKTALSAWQAKEGIYPAVGFFGPISRGKINTIKQTGTTTSQDMTITKIVEAATTSPNVVNNINVQPILPSGLPVRLKIPKINVDAGFQYNGLTPDGTMEIPNNIFDIGLFTGSPLPGEKGNSIITGHVAQIRGGVMTKPGVFSALNELLAGDKLYVINDKGESVTFVVRESRLYDPVADATDVFASTDDKSHLNIITCEGIWNPAQLSYSKRLVIFTDVVQ